MAITTKVGKTIESNTFNMSDIRTPKDPKKKNVKMLNVEIPMFNGQVFEKKDGTPGYGSNRGQLTVNLATMGPGNSHNFVGSTEQRTPVAVKEFQDLTDPANPNKGVLEIDPISLARATHVVKTEYAAANKLAAPPESARDRLEINTGWSTTKNGVGAMSVDGMKNNVAQIAAQNYIFTASKEKPETNMPTPEDIDATAKLINDTYSNVIKEIGEGKYENGLKSVRDNTKTIDGTTISKDAFDKLGIKVCNIEGATVIASNKDLTANAEAREVLNSFSKVVNAKVSQEVNNPSFTGSPMVKKLANLAKTDCYAVGAYADGKKVDGMSIVQPSVDVTFNPYAQSVIKSTELMRRTPDANGVVPTAADKYGQAVLDNAEKIYAMGGSGEGMSRDKAREVQTAMVKTIQAEISGSEKTATKALGRAASKSSASVEAPSNDKSLGE